MDPCSKHTRAMNADCRKCNDHTFFLQTMLVGHPAKEVDAEIQAAA